MCRKSQLLGCAVACFGIGMLVSCFFESGFFCCCVGVMALVAGIVLGKK